jgi:hypothetical protein
MCIVCGSRTQSAVTAVFSGPASFDIVEYSFSPRCLSFGMGRNEGSAIAKNTHSQNSFMYSLPAGLWLPDIGAGGVTLMPAGELVRDYGT